MYTPGSDNKLRVVVVKNVRVGLDFLFIISACKVHVQVHLQIK